MQTASEKLVSVVIPSFKSGQFIGEALDSVGAQTYAHWEVIVVDDAGPEDGTRATVEAFAMKHSDRRVEYIRHETNQGVSVARRTAFEASRGEYIAFLDADDAFLPEKLAKHVAMLAQHPDAVLVHGPIVEVDAQPDNKGVVAGWFAMGAGPEKYDAGDLDLAVRNHVCNSTVVARRSALKSDDFARRMYFQFEDWLLWRILQRRGSFLYCAEPLTNYRVHAGSFTQSTRWERGASELAAIELSLAQFPHLDSDWQRRVAARAVLDNLQSLLGAGAPKAVIKEGRLAFRLRCALVAELLLGDLRKLLRHLGLSGAGRH